MPSILIVDDDPIQRRLAEYHLERMADTRCLFAESGEDALALIQRERLDLVVTDLRMPGMDGLTLVRKVHQDHPCLPVILMTGFGNEELAVKALRSGAASYVPKIDLASSLAETVEQVLAVSHERRRRDRVFRYMESAESQFSLENDPELISPLVSFYQENLQRLGFGNDCTRTRVGLALVEAISNAVFHGNLEVSSSLRKENQDGYFKLIALRRQQEPYSERRVHVTASETRGCIVYKIRDEGPGFDPSTLPDPTSPDNVLRLSGRGLMLMRTFMDKVEYNASGNEVVLSKSNTHC